MNEFISNLVLDLLPVTAVHFGWYGYTTATHRGGCWVDERYNWLGECTSRDITD